MKARILVIEDEMSINDLLCMNLEIAGYETVGYLDGNEADKNLCSFQKAGEILHFSDTGHDESGQDRCAQ